MHQEAYEGFAYMLSASLVPRMELVYGLDVGGRNVNGSVRELLPGVQWAGMDIADGPDVDIVGDASRDDWDFSQIYDIVIATELFEHTPNWRAIIKNMASWLDPAGPQLFIATCASVNRRAHGASGEMWPPEGEWYQNVTKDELESELIKHFKVVEVVWNPSPGDLYAFGRDLR
jgi:hypothetical protein